MSFFAVIMAGGVGKRFWPQSRRETPKQLLHITGKESMLRLTVDRMKLLTSVDQILIVTNGDQEEGIRAEIPELPEENIILEPEGKNTAPAIGLAALHVLARDPEGIMGVFPADHHIGDTDAFKRYIHYGISAAENFRGLVTFGVVPTRPATGYGYIQFHEQASTTDPVFAVRTFAEKPDIETAQAFLHSGDFLWNSGMFVWRADVIMEAFRLHLEELHDSLVNMRDAMGKAVWDSVLTYEWATLRSVSIDYGVMEKAHNVYVVKVDFDWSDVGSWDAVYELMEKDEKGNVQSGDVMMQDSHFNLVYGDKRNITLRGVDNLIVIQTDDATLIVSRGQSEAVKNVVENLERKKRKDLL